MDESRKEARLPLRTLHEFLFEIEREWDKFRTGSLLSIVTSLLLFVLFLPRFFLFTLRRGGPLDKVFVFAIIATLLYNVYLAYGQHEFYRRWEKRLGLLLHMEEEILGEER
ncbi:hypothetical protein DRO42_00640 [Candidatus Bathyarchaeota archaeon]|nr:MAG: hypothetical protein DRO42_00640 [Candidatus Bathyarchaeota archaeon]